MKWKNRLTNYNFWISIISAVLLIFQAFDINFDIAYINEIATAVLGLLVVIGIISDPTKTFSKTETEKGADEVESVPNGAEVENVISDAEVDLQNFINELSQILENYQTEDKEKLNGKNLTLDRYSEGKDNVPNESFMKSDAEVKYDANQNFKIVN